MRVYLTGPMCFYFSLKKCSVCVFGGVVIYSQESGQKKEAGGGEVDRGGDGDDETRSRSGDKRPKRKRFIRRLHIRVQAAVRFI